MLGILGAAGVVVLAQARQALAEGSFGIGGAIIDNASGRIVHEWHNTVIQPLPNGQSGLSGTSFLFDPTNHRSQSTGIHPPTRRLPTSRSGAAIGP